MYYDFPAQILQLHFIFSEKLHKGTKILKDMQVSRLIYTISAKFPNKTPPSSQTELSPREVSEVVGHRDFQSMNNYLHHHSQTLIEKMQRITPKS